MEKKMYKPIKVHNIETNKEEIFDGIVKASKVLKMCHNTIRKCIKNGKKYKNYKFSYINK